LYHVFKGEGNQPAPSFGPPSFDWTAYRLCEQQNGVSPAARVSYAERHRVTWSPTWSDTGSDVTCQQRLYLVI